MIPRDVSFLQLKFEYLCENLTKIENILTYWSVAQIDSNYEKNGRSNISLDCPFNKQKFQSFQIIHVSITFKNEWNEEI